MIQLVGITASEFSLETRNATEFCTHQAKEDFIMTDRNLPRTGDVLYLMQKEVTVTQIYGLFSLIKVRSTEDHLDLVVDMCALSLVPDHTCSISLRLLGRDRS